MHVPARSRGTTAAKARRSSAAGHILPPLQRFLHTETTGAVILLAAAMTALLWANSHFGNSYARLWNTPVGLNFGPVVISHTVREWINEALMTVFFFVVGLEIKRELVHGELSEWRRASLPVVCALGGMIVPALLYTAFNAGQAGAHGWGIPMATDIAFALGVLALLGDRMPASARIFLLALATVDDVGAILVIAFFYTDHLSKMALLGALLLVVVLLIMRKVGAQSLMLYLPVALLFWFAVLESGVHATIAGVVLGLLTPTVPSFAKGHFVESAEKIMQNIRDAVSDKSDDEVEASLGEIEELTVGTEAPADRLVRLLHPWSSYVILPLFALANAGVVLNPDILDRGFSSPVTQGTVAGLLLGKLIGISLCALVAVRLRLASPIPGVRPVQLVGISLLAGIGFTVSLFITDLAFTDDILVSQAKLGVLGASLVAGIAGYGLLTLTARAGRAERAPFNC
jgi:NhaA family Na+:H+ antiporter